MTDHRDYQIQTILTEELADLVQIANVLSLNTHRALRLGHQSIKLAELIDDKKMFLEYMDDILRAAVVFLHSSLETALREIVRLTLKQDIDISHMPLIGQIAFPNRKEKFTPGDLAKYRGKTVDEVLNESIDGYLNSLSFNNTKDITDVLSRLGLSQSTLEQYYASLDEMIKRRHQIVHEGDLKRGQKAFELEPVSVDRFRAWLDATSEFCAEVLRLVTEAFYLDKIVERLATNGVQVDKKQVAGWISIKVEEKF